MMINVIAVILRDVIGTQADLMVRREPPCDMSSTKFHVMYKVLVFTKQPFLDLIIKIVQDNKVKSLRAMYEVLHSDWALNNQGPYAADSFYPLWVTVLWLSYRLKKWLWVNVRQ